MSSRPGGSPDAGSRPVPEAIHDAWVRAIFAHRGYKPDEVEAMVWVCREAARHGIHSHNALKAVHIDDHFGVRVGGCVPGAKIEEVPSPFPATRVWRAHRKPGPAVARQAMQVCIELAEAFGVGLVSVDQATHYLWGGAYVLEAARRGLIAGTQCTALLSEVVPFQGRTPTLGTNPHTWAFPTTSILGFPLLVDFATSALAMGRVQQFARENRPLPSGVAVDATGKETTDPRQVAGLLGFGAHKGFGLGLINEVLAALMGGWLPTERGRFDQGPSGTKRTANFLFLAIHPEALSGGDFVGGVHGLENLRQVLADIRGHGNDQVLLPGQPEADHVRRCEEAGGLLLDEIEVETLRQLAAQAGFRSE